MSSPTIQHPSNQTLIAFSSGKLDNAKAALVNQHLKACPECRRRLVKLSDANFTAPAPQDPASNKEMAARSDAIDEDRKQPSPLSTTAPRSRTPNWLIGAAGGGVVAIGLIGTAIGWFAGLFETERGVPAAAVGQIEPATLSPSQALAPTAPSDVGHKESMPATTKAMNSSASGSPEQTRISARPVEEKPLAAKQNSIDERPTPPVEKPAQPDSKVLSPVVSEEPPARQLASKPAAAPNQPLQPNDHAEVFFNGKDLTGWKGTHDLWHVENGSIIGILPAGAKQAAFLCSVRQYKDFDLRFQASIEQGIGDCGLLFRSQLLDPAHVQVSGPQCAIEGKDAPKDHWTGRLVTQPPTEVKRLPPKLVDRFIKPIENHFHVRCQGKHVLIEVNGVKTINADIPTLPDEGVIAWKLDGDRPPHRVTFKITKFAELSGLPPRTAPEQAALSDSELLKAEIKFEKAMKLADETLYKHFDGEISRLQHSGHAGEKELIGAVEHEKELFKQKGLIPWSRPMRKSLLAYGKELATARRTVGNAFDSAIDRAEKSENESRKQALIEEAGRILAPRPVATWQFKAKRIWRLVFFSDATFVMNGREGQAGSQFWAPPMDDKIVLEFPDEKDPTAAWAQLYELTPDGKTMIVILKNGQKQFWQHVED
jgi:anti-sigma factor RsiW